MDTPPKNGQMSLQRVLELAFEGDEQKRSKRCKKVGCEHLSVEDFQKTAPHVEEILRGKKLAEHASEDSAERALWFLYDIFRADTITKQIDERKTAMLHALAERLVEMSESEIDCGPLQKQYRTAVSHHAASVAELGAMRSCLHGGMAVQTSIVRCAQCRGTGVTGTLAEVQLQRLWTKREGAVTEAELFAAAGGANCNVPGCRNPGRRLVQMALAGNTDDVAKRMAVLRYVPDENLCKTISRTANCETNGWSCRHRPFELGADDLVSADHQLFVLGLVDGLTPSMGSEEHVIGANYLERRIVRNIRAGFTSGRQVEQYSVYDLESEKGLRRFRYTFGGNKFGPERTRDEVQVKLDHMHRVVERSFWVDDLEGGQVHFEQNVGQPQGPKDFDCPGHLYAFHFRRHYPKWWSANELWQVFRRAREEASKHPLFLKYQQYNGNEMQISGIHAHLFPLPSKELFEVYITETCASPDDQSSLAMFYLCWMARIGRLGKEVREHARRTQTLRKSCEAEVRTRGAEIVEAAAAAVKAHLQNELSADACAVTLAQFRRLMVLRVSETLRNTADPCERCQGVGILSPAVL